MNPKNELIIEILKDNGYLASDGRKLIEFDELISDINALTKKSISNDIDILVEKIKKYNIPTMKSGNKPFKSNPVDIKASLKSFIKKYGYKIKDIEYVLFNYIDRCINKPDMYNPSICSYISNRDKGSRLAAELDLYLQDKLNDDEENSRFTYV